ncbi:MAG TPA: RNA 2',3'-cyclic phosphodiesterase [Xanthomonadaceae bacterium]|nr:RNA 2',3'-cyclic phosphodiesterase [Xanthomonadaceae bacterium]
MPRCFFALPLPADAADSLAAFAAGPLRASLAQPRLRLIDARDLHLTLRFLGGVDEAGLPALIQGMRTISLEFPALACTNAGIAIWPDVRRPRVLVTGVRCEGPLEDLAERFEALARSLGFAAEKRRFRAHLTLARFRPGTPPVHGTLPDAPKCSFALDRIELWQSLERPGLPRYGVLDSAPLGRA